MATIADPVTDRELPSQSGSPTDSKPEVSPAGTLILGLVFGVVFGF